MDLDNSEERGMNLRVEGGVRRGGTVSELGLAADSESGDEGVGLLTEHEGDDDKASPGPRVPHRWRVTIMMALAFVLCNMDKACTPSDV